MADRRHHRRAFLALDATLALIVLAVLLAAIAGVVNRQHKATLKLADERSATRLAERALLAMQSDLPAPAPDEGTVAVTRLPDAAPAGFQWVEISAKVGQTESHLTGLARATRIGGGP